MGCFGCPRWTPYCFTPVSRIISFMELMAPLWRRKLMKFSSSGIGIEGLIHSRCFGRVCGMTLWGKLSRSEDWLWVGSFWDEAWPSQTEREGLLLSNPVVWKCAGQSHDRWSLLYYHTCRRVNRLNCLRNSIIPVAPVIRAVGMMASFGLSPKANGEIKQISWF